MQCLIPLGISFWGGVAGFRLNLFGMHMRIWGRRELSWRTDTPKFYQDCGQVVCITLKNNCKVASGLTWFLAVRAGSTHRQRRQQPETAEDSKAENVFLAVVSVRALGSWAGCCFSVAAEALYPHFHYSSLPSPSPRYCCSLDPPLWCAVSSSSGSFSLGWQSSVLPALLTNIEWCCCSCDTT